MESSFTSSSRIDFSTCPRNKAAASGSFGPRRFIGTSIDRREPDHYNPGAVVHIVARFRKVEDDYRALSRELTLEEWQQRSAWQRYLDNTMRLTAALQ